MHKLPESLQAVVDQLSRLPGLGPKSALRCAMSFLKWPESETKRLGKNIYELRDNLHMCKFCGALSDVDPCTICTDENRDRSVLCLVADWDSLLIMEQAGFFPGLFFILGGLLSPLDGVNSHNLEQEKLLHRLAQGEITELIMALGATVEAENTAAYFNDLIARKFPGIKVSRLAQGIPLGSEVKFMDRETLRQSFRFRQDLP